jgi:adenosine deaminase
MNLTPPETWLGPKVDLHVHLRGTITPKIARQLASRNHVILSERLFSGDGFAWDGFKGFLETYDAIGSVVRSGEDVHFLASEYLSASASAGALYVEFMISPRHSEHNGIPFAEQISAISAAACAASATHGIMTGVVVTCVRHHGPQEAINLAMEIDKAYDPILVGFGMAGDEHQFETNEFGDAFNIAKSMGLGLTAHAGEWRADTVLPAMENLSCTRIGHGICSSDDKAVLDKLCKRGVALEICLSSNDQLGAASLSDHPLKRLLDAGCIITLATDDPGYFQTSIAKEYELARRHFNLAECDLFKITENGVNAAFCDQDTKKHLLSKIAAWKTLHR